MQNEIQMLETLKSDFLGMQFKVEMKKYHLSGIAECLETVETMNFVDWEDACDWAGKVTMSTKVPYVILEMRNLVTNEVAEF